MKVSIDIDLHSAYEKKSYMETKQNQILFELKYMIKCLNLVIQINFVLKIFAVK